MGQIEERYLVAMDLTVMMAVCQVADESGRGLQGVLPDFLASHTAAMLYNDSCKLWWDGPDEVVDMCLAETSPTAVEDNPA